MNRKFSIFLFFTGLSMVAAGLSRGEALRVLAKAVRVCFECIGIG